MSEVETSAPETGAPSAPTGINPAFADGKADPKEMVKSGKLPGQQQEEKDPVEKPAPSYKKLKVKGKEIEVDDNKYHEYATKGAAATETWQEAAKMRREAEEFYKKLKENPFDVLKDPNIGANIHEIAEKLLWEKLQYEQLSPQEREYMEKDKKLRAFEEAEQKRAQEAAEREELEQRSRIVQELDTKVSKALAASGLPRNTNTLRRVADFMKIDFQNGVERDVGEYMDLVKEDYTMEIPELLKEMDGKSIMRFLGKDIVQKIRQTDLESVKTTTPASGHVFVPGKGMQKTEKVKKLSGADWEKEVRRSFFGK